MSAFRLLAFGLAALALAGCSARRAANAEPREHIVRLSAFRFVPAELTISAGDRVTWVNDDRFIHTTTADNDEWTSADIPPRGRFTAPVLTAGRYPYHCSAHPTMRGLLTVRDRP